MKSIGIVGVGFVGGAVKQGMSHAFDIYSYDKQKGYSYPVGQGLVHSDRFDWILQKTDGPIFVCVPTPMDIDGTCHTEIVEDVVRDIDEAAEWSTTSKRTIVIKSTVPPGTVERLSTQAKRIHICFNPEFLTERFAVQDFKNQTRIIIGGSEEATSTVKAMYKIAYPNVPIIETSTTIAEMVKYITNTFLSVKVSFANEIKMLCDELDIDYNTTIEYAMKDSRLGDSHWSVPGPDGLVGFGGSCFPKDLSALLSLAEQFSVECKTMRGAWDTNMSIRPSKITQRP